MTHCINPYCTSADAEDDLCLLFDQIDALVLNYLPDSLLLSPIDLIQETYYQKRGLLLTKQEILDAYLRYDKRIYREEEGCRYD